MSETIYLLTICLPLGTILLIFGMRSYAAVQQARARMDSEQTYRQIADQVMAAQVDHAAALVEIKNRLSAIEKVLKEVG
jgi:flagellar motor switch protein FliM